MSEDYKIIKDSVHGLLDLKPLIVKIIDTPEFQRLRYIKQLETLHYIYPCAVHNRFEHSIGTSYLARLFIEQIKRNQPELGITKQEELCVEIAGLCHDLGHGPFSHLFEDAAKKIFIKHNPNANKEDAEDFFSHEKASLLIFDRIYTSLEKDFKNEKLDEKSKNLIKQMINPASLQEILKEYKSSNDKKKLIQEMNNYVKDLGISIEKSFLFEIVSNVRNKIDVDKWDYFARDSLHLGIHNTFDYKRFILLSRVINPDETLNQICMRDKELRNVYEMFRTREDLHRRAYQLPKAIGLREVVVDILYELDDVFNFYKILKNIQSPEEIANYLDLDDRILCITQKNFSRFVTQDDLKEKVEKARILMERLNKRKFYKMVSKKIMIDYDSDDELVKDYIKAQLQQELHRQKININIKEDICIEISKINFANKNKDPLDNLEFYDKDLNIVKKESIEDYNSTMKPENFQDILLLLFVKNDSILDNKRNIKESFDKIIEELIRTKIF